ncbi:MAG TPA: hypothetical protein VN975_14135 [Xanthobacteraceae bacterium]|jgi:hypothetical protein|nr:hypothetical protein [Xanthobacteraceae bacterium]
MSELDHMDALAAEYVLGSLDVEERAQARNLLEADPTFAAKVELWERRFGELHLMVEPVEPDSGIWARIKAKLPEVQQGIRPPEPSMPPSVPPASPSPAASAPPSLDAIEAAISQAATTLSAEASSAATQEAPLALPSEVTTVSEAVPAVASETASATGSEAVPAPPSETASATGSEAVSVPVSETASAPIAEAPAVPSPEATRTSAVEAVPSPPVAPAIAAAAPQPTRDQALERTTALVRRRLRRWRAFAILMTLVVAAIGALLAAWRFAPDRVPPSLQPLELMRYVGVALPTGPAQRRPAPPESRFDE